MSSQVILAAYIYEQELEHAIPLIFDMHACCSHSKHSQGCIPSPNLNSKRKISTTHTKDVAVGAPCCEREVYKTI